MRARASTIRNINLKNYRLRALQIRFFPEESLRRAIVNRDRSDYIYIYIPTRARARAFTSASILYYTHAMFFFLSFFSHIAAAAQEAEDGR